MNIISVNGNGNLKNNGIEKSNAQLSKLMNGNDRDNPVNRSLVFTPPERMLALLVSI